MEQSATAAGDVLGPQQLAVGIEGGISYLIHGIQVYLEVKPHHVCIKIDFSNAYNTISRSAALRRLAAIPALKHLVCSLYPCHVRHGRRPARWS